MCADGAPWVATSALQYGWSRGPLGRQICLCSLRPPAGGVASTRHTLVAGTPLSILQPPGAVGSTT